MACVALAAARDRADGGDARIDEHHLLAGRGIGVELLVPAVEPVLDPIDEIGGVQSRPSSGTSISKTCSP